MKEILDRVIELKTVDNEEYLSEFPDKDPIFKFGQAGKADIINFENRFQIKLPQYLVDYFMYFDPIKSNLMFVELLGLSKISKYLEDFEEDSEILLNKYIPIADDNGDLICINSKENTGALHYYSHEDNNVAKMRGTMATYLSELIRRKEELNERNKKSENG